MRSHANRTPCCLAPQEPHLWSSATSQAMNPMYMRSPYINTWPIPFLILQLPVKLSTLQSLFTLCLLTTFRLFLSINHPFPLYPFISLTMHPPCIVTHPSLQPLFHAQGHHPTTHSIYPIPCLPYPFINVFTLTIAHLNLHIPITTHSLSLYTTGLPSPSSILHFSSHTYPHLTTPPLNPFLSLSLHFFSHHLFSLITTPCTLHDISQIPAKPISPHSCMAMPCPFFPYIHTTNLVHSSSYHLHTHISPPMPPMYKNINPFPVSLATRFHSSHFSIPPTLMHA